MKKLKRAFALLLMLLILTASVFVTAAAAEEAPEINVERILPEKLKGGKEAQITLKLTAGDEFVLGIVETLPEGWSFPEDEAAVSDCPHFELDREQRKISFAADGVSEIHYTVIPAKDAPGEISGEYVDMLWRNQELDPGRNLWHTIGGASAETAQTSASADNMDRSNTTVWVIVLVAVVVLVLLLGKKFIGKGPENEK